MTTGSIVRRWSLIPGRSQKKNNKEGKKRSSKKDEEKTGTGGTVWSAFLGSGKESDRAGQRNRSEHARRVRCKGQNLASRRPPAALVLRRKAERAGLKRIRKATMQLVNEQAREV